MQRLCGMSLETPEKEVALCLARLRRYIKRYRGLPKKNKAGAFARCLDKNFDALTAAINAGNATAAFEAAHALKGSIGNVSLTPIYKPICELTDLLRGKNMPADGGRALLEQIVAEREKALRL